MKLLIFLGFLSSAFAEGPLRGPEGAPPVSGAANVFSEGSRPESAVTLPPVTVTASPIEPEVLNTPIAPRLPSYRNCENPTGYGQPHPNFVGTWEVNIQWGCTGAYERTAWILESNGSCMNHQGQHCTWYVEGDEIFVVFSTTSPRMKFRGRVSGNSLIGTIVDSDCRTGCWAGANIISRPAENRPQALPVYEPTRPQYASPN